MATYKDSGVDKEEGYKTVSNIKEAVQRTHNAHVLNDIGSFGALFSLDGFKQPVLVSGTDGVGTKLMIAIHNNDFTAIGQDCYAMCANDILCHGAQPLFFLDYLACGKLDANIAAEIVTGIARACEATGCALIGGETAEMPGMYSPGDYDVAGFCVGAVERNEIIDGSTIESGDVIIALPSSGVHSNGFSLVRHVCKDMNVEFEGQPLWKKLLTPTALYINPVLQVLKKHTIHGIAHITGGGLLENVPRIIPQGLEAQINKSDIKVLPIFDYIQSQGVDADEMWETFNMGVGMVLIVPKNEAEAILKMLHKSNMGAYSIGQIGTSDKKIRLI